MAESQNNEVVINESQLEEIRETVSKANELFRRVGILESEKIQMMGVIHQCQQDKQQFMQRIGGEYGLDPAKLENYHIDLETGKLMENEPPQGPTTLKGENGTK